MGGIAVSAPVAIAGSLWFHVSLAAFLPLCLAAVGFSIVGDLTESLLKRLAQLAQNADLVPRSRHGSGTERFGAVACLQRERIAGRDAR